MVENTLKQLRARLAEADAKLEEAWEIYDEVQCQLDQEAADGRQHPARAAMLEDVDRQLFEMRGTR